MIGWTIKEIDTEDPYEIKITVEHPDGQMRQTLVFSGDGEGGVYMNVGGGVDE